MTEPVEGFLSTVIEIAGVYKPAVHRSRYREEKRIFHVEERVKLWEGDQGSKESAVSNFFSDFVVCDLDDCGG